MRFFVLIIAILTLCFLTFTSASVIIKGGSERDVGDDILITWDDVDISGLRICLNGEVICKETVANSNYLWDTDGLERGVYMIEVMNPYDVVVSDYIVLLQEPEGSLQLNDIYVSPNPFDLSDGTGNLVFLNIPEGSIVKIYDLGGFLVDDFTAGERNTWDGYNKDGQLVASGPYLYYVEQNGETYIGKFAVIK